MFHHIALYRFSPDSTHEQREQLRDAIEGLRDALPDLRDLRVGLDHELSNTNWHMGLVATFDDEAGYRRYADDPTHQQVIADHLHPILAERAAVQFDA